MTPDDAIGFEGALIALAAVTGKTLDPLIKRAYWASLEDVPAGTVTAALRLAMTECEFFPSAAEIRRLCDEAEGEGSGFVLTAPALPPGEVLDTYQDAIDGEHKSAWCETCQDSGFAHYVCRPGNRCTWSELCRKQIQIAGDSHVVEHTYVKKCDCLQANPVIKRRMERIRESMNVGKYYKARTRPKPVRSYGQGEGMTDADLRAAGFDLDGAWRGAREQDGLSRYLGCSSLRSASQFLGDEPGSYFSMRTVQIRAQRARKKEAANALDGMGTLHATVRSAGADQASEVRGGKDHAGRDHLSLEEGSRPLDDLEGASPCEGD